MALLTLRMNLPPVLAMLERYVWPTRVIFTLGRLLSLRLGTNAWGTCMPAAIFLAPTSVAFSFVPWFC